jgi:hypothetical protein
MNCINDDRHQGRGLKAVGARSAIPEDAFEWRDEGPLRRTILSLGLAALVVLVWPATALAATDPGLRTAGSLAVLAGTPNITSAGSSWISGEVGISPGCAVTGFPPGASGVQHNGMGDEPADRGSDDSVRPVAAATSTLSNHRRKTASEV